MLLYDTSVTTITPFYNYVKEFFCLLPDMVLKILNYVLTLYKT